MDEGDACAGRTAAVETCRVGDISVKMKKGGEENSFSLRGFHCAEVRCREGEKKRKNAHAGP